VIEGVTGEFFDSPDPAALARAMRALDPSRYDPPALRAHAERFSPARFVAEFRGIVAETLAR
jgi:hypothetical protein